MKKIIIIGGGDLCHKIVRLIQRDNIFDIIGYVDVKDRGTIFNAKYLGNDGVIEKFNKKVKKLCVALAFGGNMQYFPKRKIIINKILKIGVDTPPIISKLASFDVPSSPSLRFSRQRLDPTTPFSNLSETNFSILRDTLSFIGAT